MRNFLLAGTSLLALSVAVSAAAAAARTTPTPALSRVCLLGR